MSQTNDSNSDLRAQKTRQVVRDCLRRRAQGESVSEQSLMDEHPDLMPELGEELKKLRVIEAMGRQTESKESRDGAAVIRQALSGESPGGMRVRCPHCQSAVAVVADTPFTDITCDSCGSIFSLVGEAKETRQAPTLTTIGHFQLLERLGMGGFGTVWKGRDTELDRAVAVKIPRRGELEPAEIEQFLREARAAAQLSHPNIASIYEVGRDGQTVYIVTQLLRGISLSDWLTGRRMNVREAAQLCRKVAEALEHAHQRGVIHRDLKPQNIMIDESGEPSLMDFGLARREAGEITMTLDGQVLGTPAYMSPEQAKGESRHADRRSDIYSAGVILFELLTGELPFRGNARMLVHQVIHDEPPSPRKLNNNIPRDVSTICLKCLEKDPRKRYDSAQGLADDLARYLDGRPILARPITRAARTWRWCRRNPVVATLTAVLCLVLVLTIAYAINRRADSLRLRHILAQQYLRKGQTFCEDGDVARGLHWFVRSLDTAPATSTALHEVVRQNLSAWGARSHVPLAIFDQTYTLHVPSPDATRVATVDDNGTVRIWSVLTGEPVGAAMHHDGPVHHLVFSPDGRLLITTSGKTTRVWSTETGQAQATLLLDESRDYGVGFCSNGRRVVTWVTEGDAEKVARFWSPETGKSLGEPICYDGADEALAFSPDGSGLLTGSPDGTATLWSESGDMVQVLRGHSEPVSSGRFSPDGRRILTGASDDTARLWDAETGEQFALLKHQDDVTSVEFSPDGKRIATGSRDGTARLWSADTGAPVGAVMQHERAVEHVVFSPDGKYVMSFASDTKTRFWSAETGQSAGRMPLPHKDEIIGFVFSADGQTVLFDEISRCVLWSMKPTNVAVQSLPGHQQHWVAFSPNGRYAATGSITEYISGPVSLYSVESGERIIQSPVQVGSGPVLALAYSPDGRVIAAGGCDETVLLSAETGLALGRIQHKGCVLSVAFSPDGRMLATGGFLFFDRTVRIWSTATAEEIRPELQHPGVVEDVAFSADGKFLLTACVDGAARLWSVETGKLTIPPMRHGNGILAAVFSPDGKLIATGSSDHTTRFWHAASGDPTGLVLEHQSGVQDVCFTPDGKHVLTASEDGKVRFWSLETGEQVGPPLIHDRQVLKEVAISPDGTRVLVGMDGPARLWTLPAQAPSREIGQVDTWVQFLTLTEMDENGVLHWLSASAWRDRRQLLQQQGESIEP